MTLRFRPEVSEDLKTAHDWYERRRPGLGDEFLLAVEALLERVAATPGQFPKVHGEVRRGLLRRFPYAVFFCDADAERLVLAVMHQAVSPSRWHRRS